MTEEKLHRTPRILRVAAILALVGLGFMVWSLLDPRPGPVLIGLSLGQAVGTLSFAIYAIVVVSDIRRRMR